VGHYHIPFELSRHIWEWKLWHSQVWTARIYRLGAAGLVGIALATAGLALQAILRNPLAEPYILGISSGAGVGVLAGGIVTSLIVLPEWGATPVLALAGALVTALVVYGVAQRRGRLDPYVLLLSGVIINIFNGALILALLQLVKQDEIVYFIGWGMGQIPEWLWFRPNLFVLAGLLILTCWVFLLIRSAAFNTLNLGDEVAASAGVAVQRLRIETFILVSVATAAAVSLAGPIGFVGLIVPHVCRLKLGPDHRVLVIVAGFGGAAFLMVADTLCRLLGEAFRLGELPVGVITALSGAPFFVYLLRSRLRGEES
jgi:iron complex transport system permease protein